jgi:predicted nucleotidyltransferase
VALYSDKHTVFRINNPEREGELTQFSRALKTLDIEAIHANTPQAKGRVERANKTLQDRLVKELRLQGISDIDAANDFLPGFMTQYNTRFAVPPQNPLDAHREAIVADILEQQLPEHEVWAFGSRARHSAKRYSDLDLAIISNEPLPLQLLARVNAEFSDSDLPWCVDLLDWATTEDAFRNQISQCYCVVKKRRQP